MKADPKWKRLYESALAENDPARLGKCLRDAEVAMTSAAQAMLNDSNATPGYEELMTAMLKLYEHGLRKGINIPEGTYDGSQK